MHDGNQHLALTSYMGSRCIAYYYRACTLHDLLHANVTPHELIFTDYAIAEIVSRNKLAMDVSLFKLILLIMMITMMMMNSYRYLPKCYDLKSVHTDFVNSASVFSVKHTYIQCFLDYLKFSYPNLRISKQ